MVNYDELIKRLSRTDEPFGLLTMQATSTTSRLMKVFPNRLKALYAAEHGFFGTTAAGELTQGSYHPFFNLPIHSLYGEFRKPTPEMLSSVKRMVIDLCDIGVRCYSYLATLKYTLEACAENGVPVTVLDREVPMGDVVDGPMRENAFAGFVAPINVPFCHGMTPGECALWIRANEKLDLDLDVVPLKDWNHRKHEPWPNFIPPSPEIRSWDSAVAYPMTVFTEAYPSLDCDRDGPLAYRVLGAPWLDSRGLMEELRVGLDTCGVEMRPYRYMPHGGRYSCFNLNGIMFSVSRPYGYNPVTAGVLVLSALVTRSGDKVSAGSRPEILDRLMGTAKVRRAVESGELGALFQGWIDAHDEFEKTKVCLY